MVVIVVRLVHIVVMMFVFRIVVMDGLISQLILIAYLDLFIIMVVTIIDLFIIDVVINIFN